MVDTVNLCMECGEDEHIGLMPTHNDEAEKCANVIGGYVCGRPRSHSLHLTRAPWWRRIFLCVSQYVHEFEPHTQRASSD